MKQTKSQIKKIGWGFGRCNMNCRHCYNASGKNTIAHNLPDLKIIADKICSQGITDINFGTGEFFINPNAMATAQYIKEKYPQVKLGLTSNGYSVIAMDKTALKNIFHDVDISVDFPNKERHNDFRRHPLAWDWANRALQICQELDMPRSVVTCVNAETTDADIVGLLQLAKKYQTSLRVNWFRPTGRGEKDLCITAHRYWQIIQLLTKHAIFEGLSDPLLRAFLTDAKTADPCACGWTSARIQQDLTVTPCVFLKGEQWGSGHILSDSLDKIYEHKNFRAVRLRRPNICKTCQHFSTCHGGCASRAFLQAGGLNKPDAYCPLSNSEIKKIIEIVKKNIIVEDSDKVHNGYLCTLIIKPK